MTEKILVIKLSAFGDFIQALGPMAAIRRHHPHAHITLLTTAPFVTLAQQSGYFDAVRIDRRPKWTQPLRLFQLAMDLRAEHFFRVYDLQNNDRTALYLKLLGPRPPQWVGAAPHASHRNASPERTAGHAFDGHVQTLKNAGINDISIDDLSWIRGDASHFGLPHPFVLLVPGSSPEHLEKRWAVESFCALACQINAAGFAPVIIGTAAEANLALTIQKSCPNTINLCGQTAINDLVLLAREAAGAIGNDTGPMHIISPTGCPTLVLFSSHSDPVRHKPLGPRVRVILQNQDTLGEISVDNFRHKAVAGAH